MSTYSMSTRLMKSAVRAGGPTALVLLASAFMSVTPGRAADAGPTLLKRTIHISARRFLRYWKSPTAKEPVYNTWCWMPKMDFQVTGPVPAGEQFIVDFAKADGSPWFSVTCDTPQGTDEALVPVKTPDEDESTAEKKGILAVGTFPFKIRLKNGPAGPNTLVFSGKYRVKTYTPAGNIPEYKNKAEFYVLQDWRLPIGFLSLDSTQDEKMPSLYIQLWFRGPDESTAMEAHLYYNGKEIASNKDTGTADLILNTGVGDAAYRWARMGFGFPTVRGFNQETDSANNSDALFFLDKHPGDYEVRVLEKKILVRSAKFTVGADGKIIDNGIATKNHLGGSRMVIPVKVLGTMDHNWNPLEWTTDAFYGNPLVGFTAP